MRRTLVPLVALVMLAVPRPLPAQPVTPTSAQAEFKALVDTYWAVWATGDVAKAGQMYAKDPGLVFYDLEPLKYAGWDQYSRGVGPNILDKFTSVRFTVNDDLTVTEHGDVAWTTVTVHADGVLKATGPMTIVIRHTTIWEKRAGRWLIVHEHVSVPAALPVAPAAK